ncbi:hypothetical protein HUJ04_004713 [Dendroctonus ponderosae]|nr:hypothetical protein HUJ04_004713 [Dendroctonus ponderosae]KAH1007489.1 hypothetical protein HUJ04_004713 [Dendroctonus ponderosae]KAH1014995.1 hypothetical protein HUJ05_012784 [Dendroctonus ponderosae]KAH1014996.1 hypothetical protein HUJ05_012784 [Dendroctonus ponderosae]
MALRTDLVFCTAIFMLLTGICIAYPDLGFHQFHREPLFTRSEVDQLLEISRPTREGTGQSGESIVEKPAVPQAVKNWPAEDLKLGQVTAVSVNSALQPVIFHRADREWDRNTFNMSHHYLHSNLGPIADHTVLTLDPSNGKVLEKWGANAFYMPHGLTIDRHDNYFLTDVGMHQAFKFKRGQNIPTLVFGELFVPGSDHGHLCKPTSIAVASTGEIFIADGYCNSRILKYNAAGGLLRVIPSPSEFLSLQVPHSLALIESTDRLCIADRENMRVVCPRAGLYSVKGRKESELTIQQPDMGRLFAVAAKGKLIYAVNGFTNQMLPGFSNPHDIAISATGETLYVAEIGPNKIWKFDLVPPKK